MPSQNLTYTKLADRNVSFGLLRTNPKLTSNLKLTVDSGGDLWFNSINANEQLAQQKYKKFAVNPESNHEVNIFKFYDMGSTPSKISYGIGSSIRTDVIAKNLKDQYDFDLYTSGAKYLTSKNYSEKFSYLAPLYLDKVLPEYFVIFKVAGASNYTAADWYQKNGTVDQKTFAKDLFRNSTIVKAVPLTESSNIGTYIRRILANPMYPENPLYVNIKKDKYSLYRGASINSGTYVEIPEIISSTLTKSIPQLTLEKYITGGFERNNVIYPKILNLEFLFNDDTAEPYEFNRYFGFYCNTIDLATFDIDLNQMYENEDNDNPLPAKFKQSDEISLTISNPNGVVLRAENLTEDLSFVNTALDTEESLFFPYLKTKNDDLHFLKTEYSTNATTFSQLGSNATFAIDNSEFDLGLTFGPDELFSQEKATAYTKNTRTSLSVTIESAPSNLDTLRVYHQNGSTFDKTDNNGRYDDIVFVSGYFLNGEEYSLNYPTFPVVNFDTVTPTGTSIFTPNLPGVIGTQYTSSQTGVNWIWNGSQYVVKTIGSRIYVNIENATINTVASTDTTKLAQTVVTIIEKLVDSFLIGSSFKNTAIIQTRAYGNGYGMLAAKTIQSSSAIKLNSNLTNSTVYADGGFLESQQAIIPIGNIERLTPILDEIVVKTQKDWSKILRVCRSTAGLNNETGELTQASINAFNSNATLMLEDEEPIIIQYNKIEIRKLFKPKIGVLSIFDIKDIDFNVFSSDYSKIPEVDLYQYYWVPANVQILDFTKYKYSLIGIGTIQVNEIVYDSSSIDMVWQDREGLHSYSVLAGDVTLVQSNILPYSANTIRTDIGIYDEDENLQNFTGFFSLGADHSAPDPALATYQYRDKFKTNNLASEYHIYLENFAKAFAIDGRVVPYISKWGIVNSTDARGNAYRLNSDIAFGKDNFGPSHRETTPTAEKLTHEWFYIESDFNYSLDENLLKKNYYYFNSPINIQSLISESDYFERYFTYIPTINGIELNHPQFRYSKTVKDEFTNQYNTIFNGAKFIFSELKDTGEILPVTNRFEDYNFSILLKPVKEDLVNPQSPVLFRVIENMDAKSILILIEVAIGDISKINPALLTESSQEMIDAGRQFEDLRLDQTKLFLNSKIIYNQSASEFNISAIYTAASSTEFNSLKSGIYPNVSGLAGTAIDPVSTQSVDLLIGGTEYDVENYPVILVEYGGEEFILAFSNSQLFIDATNQELLSGSYNSENTSQYLTFSNPVHVILGPTGSDLIRIFDNSTDPTQVTPIPLTVLSKFSVVGAKPSFLGAFGDYRISFNQDNVSNLTYNFIYSVKDKKYNSTKSAFSTVKLAAGVDISGGSVYVTPEQVSTVSQNLAQIPTNAFVLEDFINPISAAFDTITNPSIGAESPLPAFSPLLFINQTGIASIPLKTSADFSGNTSLATVRQDLSNPTVTTHLLKTVQENLLIFETPEIIYEFSELIILDPAYLPTTTTTTISGTTTTTTISGTTTTTTAPFPGIDLSNNYVGQYITATIFGIDSTKLKVGDVVKIEDNTSSAQYLRAQITTIQTASSNLLITFLVRYQTGAGSNSNDWIISCKRDTIILKPKLQAAASGPTLSLTSSAFPGGSTSDWLNSSQQFQLFGGKSYFTNLFENISFANFISLLSNNSSLVKFETYQNGVLIPGQKIKLGVETADHIVKNTIVTAVPEQIETASTTVVGGFTHIESKTQKYEVFRYSGEYDVLYRPIAGFKYASQLGNFDLRGSNCLLNPNIKDFFIMPEFSFVKYAETQILDLESSTKYKAEYPLIGESPIDSAPYNCLSSSWDFGYHYKYLTKSLNVKIPGTNRITEDYSFASKLLNVPTGFTAESFNTQQLTNAQFEITDSAFAKLEANGSIVDIAYSVYKTEIKLKINLANIIAKTLIDAGLRAEFQKFFVDSLGNPLVTDLALIGELTLEQYLTAYCKANLVKLYELDVIEFYEKPDHLLADNSLSLAQVPYSQLDDLDYSLIKEVKINNPKSAILSGSIYKKSSTGVSLVPKLKIKYI